MIRYSFLYASLFLACSAAFAQTQKSTFTLIHSDVYSADRPTSLTGTSSKGTYNKFDMVERIIQMGDRYKVAITLEVNPDLADIILADATKLTKVRQWQRNGHEIAALHRSPSHLFWDGYTNYTQTQYTSSPFRRRAAEFRGTMAQFYAKLDSVAGDSLVLTQNVYSSGQLNLSPSEADVEWGGNAKYSGYGDGMGASVATAFSNPEETIVGLPTGAKYTICRITHLFLDNSTTLSNIITEYPRSTKTVAGIVIHPVNIFEDSTAFIGWLQFAALNNPQSIRNIMRKAACPSLATSVAQANKDSFPFRVFPNPASSIVSVRFRLEKSGRVLLKVFNALGQEVAQILDAEMSVGEHTRSLEIRHWSLVNQTLFLQLNIQNSTFKTLPIQVMR